MADRQLLITRSERDAAYRDRARLAAVLAGLWPSVMVRGGDPALPEWWVLYIESPAGQIGYHVHPRDRSLLRHVAVVDTYEWDRHSTDLKNERLAHLAAGADLTGRI